MPLLVERRGTPGTSGAAVAGAGPVRRRLDAAIALSGALLLTAGASLRIDGGQVLWPDGTALGAMCWSRTLLGLSCPMCGMTRSVIALAHGELGASLAFHPGGVLVVLVLLGGILGAVFAAVAGRRPISARPGYWRSVEVTALACLAAGLARSLCNVCDAQTAWTN
jgi:hypothetical protein